MGVVLGLLLCVGICIGTLLSVVLIIPALSAVVKRAKIYKNVWRVFVPVLSVLMILLVLGVRYYPYDTGPAGSNYSLLAKYFFVLGLAYALIPGIVTVVAFLAAKYFCMKRI